LYKKRSLKIIWRIIKRTIICINLLSIKPTERIKVAGAIEEETTLATIAVLRAVPEDVL